MTGSPSRSIPAGLACYEAAQGIGVFEGDAVGSTASDRCGSLWIPAHSSVVG
jgi:hypothetical protein